VTSIKDLIIIFRLEVTRGIQELQADSLEQETGHHIGVNVCAGSTVLEVSLPCLGDMEGNSNRSASVRDTPAKLPVGAGLVMSRESTLDTVTVVRDMELMALAELLTGDLDVEHSLWLAHLAGGEVRVCSGSIELCDRLRVETDCDAVLLTKSIQKPPRDPEVVRYSEGVRCSYLILPLTGHHLCVDSTDLDSRVEAGCKVLLHELSTKDLIRADTAVERTLLRWISAERPAQRATVFEHRVFLLDPKERIMRDCILRYSTKQGSSIGRVRSSISV